MRLYDCHVRLSDSTLHEVPKFKVTAGEIIVLRDIHGAGAVVRISPVGQDKRSHAGEYVRLGSIYGENRIESLFGSPHASRMPVELDPETEKMADQAAQELELRNEERQAEMDAEVAKQVADQTEVIRREAEAKVRAEVAAEQNASGKDGKSNTLSLKK